MIPYAYAVKPDFGRSRARYRVRQRHNVAKPLRAALIPSPAWGINGNLAVRASGAGVPPAPIDVYLTTGSEY